MAEISRRDFIGGAGMAMGAYALSSRLAMAQQLKSPFKVAIINDEISQDFELACSVVSREFGLSWIELRSMWGKNMQSLTSAEIGEAKKILAKYGLKVTDIASPLFKVAWPGAPQSKFGKKGDSFKADFDFKHQQEVMEGGIELAKEFGTRRLRCFDFWRIDDVKPYRAAINAKLAEAAATCGKKGILLVLENEFECNTATGREAAATLAAIPSPHLMLNWDPGNAVMAGEMDAFPAAWDLLPKNRIGHCHVKNAVKGPEGKIQWAPVAVGYVDWTAQFKALKATGYHEAVSLETHWRGGNKPEEATRISWKGMKEALRNAGCLS